MAHATFRLRHHQLPRLGPVSVTLHLFAWGDCMNKVETPPVSFMYAAEVSWVGRVVFSKILVSHLCRDPLSPHYRNVFVFNFHSLPSTFLLLENVIFIFITFPADDMTLLTLFGRTCSFSLIRRDELEISS